MTARAGYPPQEPTKSAALKLPAECLVLPGLGTSGRSAFHVDPVEAQIVNGQWKAPHAGESVISPGGSVRKWEAAKLQANGSPEHGRGPGAYIYVSILSAEQHTVMLQAAGHGMVYVNGEPRGGDPYGFGNVHLPVLLKAGSNDFLFQVARGGLTFSLVPPKAQVQFDLADQTTPDLPAGKEFKTWVGVVVVHSGAEKLDDLLVEAKVGSGPSVTTKLAPTIPFSARKVAIQLIGTALPAGNAPVHLILRQGQVVKDKAELNLGVKTAEQLQKETFLSSIDDSVQYYALLRAKASAATQKKGLILTLHGAGVEGVGQAACYQPKTWADIVAPTNRRAYGFDWEDWGRLDALEVLQHVQKELDTDPQQVYLTGHSMGGHGAWHLAALYPDLFAAIGPSSGWVSMWSYAGLRRSEHSDAVQEMLLRSSLPSDTLALARNYSHLGIYVLHGDKDDNVPVTQARIMEERLSGSHSDFIYDERPGAGHWYGGCVDWQPMLDFLARHRIPTSEQVRQVDFATASPGVSAQSHWVTIEAQLHPFKLSTVSLRHDPAARYFGGTTANVARLSLNLAIMPPNEPVTIKLDGQSMSGIAWPQGEARIWFVKEKGKWTHTGKPLPALKGPVRYGPFREAFRNHMLFVYGTRGTLEENAWAFAKARFDAETFAYRGNGAVQVTPDTGFKSGETRERNVILYGNADTNGAWQALLGSSPVQVSRGKVRIARRT